MDSKLLKAIARNEIRTFTTLVRHNEGILAQRDASLNTPLHLAARFGHIGLAEEIVKLCPDMVEAENDKQENPLHEACRQGSAVILNLLLNTNPLVANKLNQECQSGFLVACRQGHLRIVKLMLNQRWLMEFEEDCVESTPLHVAISRGHIDIVKEILKVRPNFAGKADKNGISPLHYASSRGNLEITRLLLSLDQDLALQYNNYGYTPLHLAAINGNVKILEAFIAYCPTSFEYCTKDGETVFHLAVRFDKQNAFMCLAKSFNFTNLLHRQDQFGNTILHLAVLRKNDQLVKYIISETKVDINCQNNKGLTALDILQQAGIDARSNRLQEILKFAGGIRSSQISTPEPEVKEIVSKLTFLHPETSVKQGESSGTTDDNLPQTTTRQEGIDLPMNWHPRLQHRSKSCGYVPPLNVEPTSTNDLVEQQPEEKYEVHEEEHPSEPESSEGAKDSPSNLQRYKDLSRRRRKELSDKFKSRQNKENEMQMEALQNARNTIILVAILIATVTYTAGITPPGGVYQEGPLKGKSTVDRTTAFKIFSISNNIALFTSLSIVLILGSLIPFRRKQLMKLLVITHKLMWVSVLFMAMAYVAATLIIVQHGRGTSFMIDVSLAVSAGVLVVTFVYLGAELGRHSLRKSKWRAENGRKQSKANVIREKIQSRLNKAKIKGEIRSVSTNSDLDSSTSVGYYAY